MNKRLRYPDRFATKREMLWYIRGLMDAKKFSENTIDAEIRRYRDTIPFTDFKENLTKHNSDFKKNFEKALRESAEEQVKGEPRRPWEAPTFRSSKNR